MVHGPDKSSCRHCGPREKFKCNLVLSVIAPHQLCPDSRWGISPISPGTITSYPENCDDHPLSWEWWQSPPILRIVTITPIMRMVTITKTGWGNLTDNHLLSRDFCPLQSPSITSLSPMATPLTAACHYHPLSHFNFWKMFCGNFFFVIFPRQIGVMWNISWLPEVAVNCYRSLATPPHMPCQPTCINYSKYSFLFFLKKCFCIIHFH